LCSTISPPKHLRPLPPPTIPAGRGVAKRARRARNRQFQEERKRGGHRGAGFVFWQELQLRVRIDWNDPVVAHAACCRVKYVRLLQNKASSPRASGAGGDSLCYWVQLVVEGVPLHKPKHQGGKGQVGADLGPSTYAVLAQEGEARLDEFCAELSPKAEHGKAIRRLQRKLDRQRRAANPHHYDEQGRAKKGSKKKPLRWKNSRGYERIRRKYATTCRKRASHRKSLHGKLAHEIAALGDTIILERNSYGAWQKQFGRSVSERAPGMFVAQLRRTGASHGRHPDRSSHTHHAFEPVLPWLRGLREKAAVAALSRVLLRDWSHPAGSVFGLSGSLSRCG